jgi:type I restriction enzyme R subunit
MCAFSCRLFKADGAPNQNSTNEGARKAVADAILRKHHAAIAIVNLTQWCLLINEILLLIIGCLKLQADKLSKMFHYRPLNIACVFSPPAQLLIKMVANAQKN